MTQKPKQLTNDVKAVAHKSVEGLVPPAAAVFELINAARRRRFEKNFDVLTNGLVEAMGLPDRGALMALIQQNEGEDWCISGFEEGFQAVISSLDESAKKCALLLVSDYLKKANIPDRCYKQFAALFAEADEPILKIALQIGEALAQIQRLPNDNVFVCVSTDMYYPNGAGELIFEVHLEGKEVHLLTPAPNLGHFSAACKILIRNDFLSEWTRSGAIHPKNYHIARFLGWVDPHHVPLWERLCGYLAPVRAK